MCGNQYRPQSQAFRNFCTWHRPAARSALPPRRPPWQIPPFAPCVALRLPHRQLGEKELPPPSRPSTYKALPERATRTNRYAPSASARGGVAEEQSKPMTLLRAGLQRLAGLSELPLPLREKPSPLSSASTKIKPGKPAPAMGPGTSSVSLAKTRTPPECASEGGVSGTLITGFVATAGGLHLGNTSAIARPLMLPTHPFKVDYRASHRLSGL